MAAEKQTKAPSVPPRWFVRTAWAVHRAILRLTRAKAGLWRPKPGGWGALRLTVVGRKSGKRRDVVVGYVEDGDDLVTIAMNGWGEGQPAWWLNLRDAPDATVRLVDGTRKVRARAATGAERDRLWGLWVALDPNYDAFAGKRATETPVVVLSPRP